MNKTYQDSIERARAISEGIKNNAQELDAKGYNTAFANQLLDIASRLNEASDKYDELNDAASAQRKVCHDLLDQLKEVINDAKTGVKTRYLQTEWIRFGLVDKR